MNATGNKLIQFGVKALLIRDNKFLAMHRRTSKHAKYELPGGRMEFGETAEETVIREVMEETGLQITPISLVDTWNWMGDTTWQVTGIVYLCTHANGDSIVLSDEHDEYVWFPATEESFEKMNIIFAPQMRKWDWNILLTKVSAC